MEDAAKVSVAYLIMLVLSAAIATLGLIANSTAVIIGAMIIAPLMNPIIACTYSGMKGDLPLLGKSVFSIVFGIITVLIVSATVTWLSGSQLKGSEILARSNPSLLDLGIAAASGMAGAAAWTQKKISSTLPGVAIAVALVPPLCTTGIGLALGDTAIRDPLNAGIEEVKNIEQGSMLLFLTNLAAMLFFGGIVFLVQGYGKPRRAVSSFIISLCAIVVLGMPLKHAYRAFKIRSLTMDSIHRLSSSHENWRESYLYRMSIDSTNSELVIVRLFVLAPKDAISLEDVESVEHDLSKRLNCKVRLDLFLSNYENIRSISKD